MGKDSLIKSTSKKKSSRKKKDEARSKVKGQKAVPAKKKTAKPKKSAKAAPKKTKAASTTKTKTAPKTKVVAKKKAAPEVKAVVKPEKISAKPKKKLSVKELTFKKFDLWEPAKPLRVETEQQDPGAFSAPPIIDTVDKNEFKRLKALLLQKYDYSMLKKAAAEKAAAEKAAAEKAAAEKAAAEKTAKESQPSTDSGPPPPTTTPSDPAGRMMGYGLGALLLLILLIVGASFLNHRHYYIKTVDGAVEIWQGKFAPKGTSRLISLPGMRHTAPAKPEYTRQEVFPLIFAFYRDKAATLMEVKGMPDFDAEKVYLEKALLFSTTLEEKAEVNARLNSIDLMVLMSKADAAASRKTVASLETALTHLEKAADLEIDNIQAEQVKRKTARFQTMLEKLKQQEAKAKENAQKAKLAEAQAKKAQAEKIKADKKAAEKGKNAPESEAGQVGVKAEKAH